LSELKIGEEMRIRVRGHEEGDLMVLSLHGSSGDLTDGIIVHFEKRGQFGGVFVLNTADLEAVIAKAKV
jgi:hypothetical protein